MFPLDCDELGRVVEAGGQGVGHTCQHAGNGTMNETGREQFVGEAIEPLEGVFTTTGAAPGEPLLPARFRWRDEEYRLAEVLRKWKSSSPCRHGSREVYLRKHWYRIRTTDGTAMTIYFERQARQASKKTKRWWVYTIAQPD